MEDIVGESSQSPGDVARFNSFMEFYAFEVLVDRDSDLIHGDRKRMA